MVRFVALAALSLLALPARAGLDPALASEGWRSIPFAGQPGLAIVQDGETGVRIEGVGGIAVAYQAMRVPVGPNTCLAWRWRVDQGPPPTDLTRSSGADRSLALWVGFEPDAERMGLLQRYLMGIATMSSGRRMVPGFILLYVHGGTGEEPLWHRSPLTGGLGRTMVVAPGGTAMGEWVEHEMPLAQHFRAAFGIAPTGFVTELAIGADGDDTQSAISGRIGEIRFKPCGARPQAVR
jgi:hypothetical protein